ncbi:MAG: glycosyltransferase family 2 protein [Spirochaetes bacterium]|nr:glycosyltransferase family 2 protein [Spirochaetota bacterium]
MKLPKISVIIALHNEEKYIYNLLKTITDQDYDISSIEYIFVDGNSKDRTKNIINDFIKENQHINIILLNNPKRRIPISFNIGIKKSSNSIIFILGAHSEYPNNYLKKCVTTLIESKSHNVGGVLKTQLKNKSLIGKAIRYITSSKFGVGNSMFRTSKKSGKTDTVLFFCFYKHVTDKIGMFDERIWRNQDNEFNYRLKKNNFILWQDSDIIVKYYNVESFTKLLYQGFLTGKWNLWTTYIHPLSLSLRHFIPFIFVVYLITSSIFTVFNSFIGTLLLSFALIPYFSINIFLSVYYGIKDRSPITFLLIPTFFLYHFSYGLGSLFGLFILPFKIPKFRKKYRGW